MAAIRDWRVKGEVEAEQLVDAILGLPEDWQSRLSSEDAAAAREMWQFLNMELGYIDGRTFPPGTRERRITDAMRAHVAEPGTVGRNVDVKAAWRLPTSPTTH